MRLRCAAATQIMTNTRGGLSRNAIRPAASPMSSATAASDSRAHSYPSRRNTRSTASRPSSTMNITTTTGTNAGSAIELAFSASMPPSSRISLAPGLPSAQDSMRASWNTIVSNVPSAISPTSAVRQRSALTTDAGHCRPIEEVLPSASGHPH